jgi:hypothetical protein
LITATGAPIQDKWITFRELPSGRFYYPSFVKRAISPLVKSVGEKPEILKKVAGTMGQIVELPVDKALDGESRPRATENIYIRSL